MREPQQGQPAIYAAAILAAVVAVILLSRRLDEQSSPAERAAPVLARAARARESAPRPLVITERVASVPMPEIPREEIVAGFPDEGVEPSAPASPLDESIYSPSPDGATTETSETVKDETVKDETESRRLPGLEAGAATQEPELSPPHYPATSSPEFNPAIAPLSPQIVDDDSLRRALQQAAQLNRQAESFARRGACYLARNLTTQSLRTVAEALDLQSGGSGEHTAALASALAALREADDFRSRSQDETTVSVTQVVAGHRTPVLKQGGEGLSPLSAQHHYHQFARRQLIVAAGGQPVASHSLCNLGKLQLKLSSSLNAPQADFSRAMVFQQAALAVDHRNFLAANELGGILATAGQLAEARRLLRQSVETNSNADGWNGLAKVHERLGETELASHARAQRDLVGGGTAGTRPRVEWVSPDVFAGNAPAGAEKQAAISTAIRSDQRSADNRPKQKETWISPFGIKR